mgnify:CR=1 FL=1
MDQTSRFKGKIVTDQAAGNITRSEELAYELKIAEVMSTQMQLLSPDMHMGDVLAMFRQAHISGAPVVENGKCVGIISIEDTIRCLLNNDMQAPVSEYMTRNVITINSVEPVISALKTFVTIQVGRLPVVNEGGDLVGILTKGDITRGLLKALQHDYQAEEVIRYRASHLFEDIESDRTSLILRYNIAPRDFTKGGAASSNIKRALVRLGAPPQIARRTGIAVYEAEINLIIHTTNGGVIRVEIEPQKITIDAYDDGPGIADIDQALRPGFSTATNEVRELGFGAGMGLVNISRCVDSMKLESTVGVGTRLKMKINLETQDAFREGSTATKETKA